MIVRERPSGLRLFLVLRGSVLPRILPALAVSTALAIVVTFTHGLLFDRKITLTTIPFTLMGLPLAIFLGFRNNAAYDRYWEGRKLWGELVLRCRSLARQCQSLIVADGTASMSMGLQDVRVRMILRAVAFVHVLKLHLRDIADSGPVREFLSEADWRLLQGTQNRPHMLLMAMGDDLRLCLSDGRIDPCLAAKLDDTLSSLNAAAAACERIKGTPIPFSYTLMLHRTAYLYCFLLPFGLVDLIGFMTPLVVAIVAYTFFGLDALGDEIEEPFGQEPNDLPLDAICRTIEINLREALGDVNLPGPLVPVDYLLS